MARISSGDRIEYAGLQAADYLSWGIRSQFMTAGPDPDKWDMEMDDVSREILALLGAPLVYRIPKFGIYYEKSLAKLCQDAKIPLKKDVPPEMWSGKRPIRFKFPATKP